jgi:RNA recognition motif-containing protein
MGLIVLNIYVGNLPYDSSDEDLEALFSQFGEVSKATIVMDRETGRSRGFGFVEMMEDDEGRRAIEQVNGTSFNSRMLTVNEARPRAPRPNGGGGMGRGRGYGGGGYEGQRAGGR